MSKKDITLVTVIGAAVGLLVQPILINLNQQGSLTSALPGSVSFGSFQALVFFCFLILAPIALYIAHLLSQKMTALYQFAKFAAVGSLNTFLDLGIFNLETFLYGAVPGGFVYPIFKSISFLIATGNSFLWNKFWTFGSSSRANAGEVAKFYIITVGGWAINVGVATLVKNVAVSSGLSLNLWGNVLAPVCGVFAGLFWNFFGYKIFVFKKSEPTVAA